MIDVAIIFGIVIVLALVAAFNYDYYKRSRVFLDAFKERNPVVVAELLKKFSWIGLTHYSLLLLLMRHPQTLSDPDLARMNRELQRRYNIWLAAVFSAAAVVGGMIWAAF